jgi:hypothetical protein
MACGAFSGLEQSLNSAWQSATISAKCLTASQPYGGPPYSKNWTMKPCVPLRTLSLKEVGQRVARFVLTEARRNGVRTDQGFSLNLRQTNQQIAAQAGTVREVISRSFSRLQHDGLTIVEDRKLTIPHEDALAVFAEQNQGRP